MRKRCPRCGRKGDSGALGDRCPDCGRDGREPEPGPARRKSWLWWAAERWAAERETEERRALARTW